MKINLTDDEVIELAYLCKDVIEFCDQSYFGTSVGEVFRKFACAAIIRKMLKVVDPIIFNFQHTELRNFYSGGRVIPTDTGHLCMFIPTKVRTGRNVR